MNISRFQLIRLTLIFFCTLLTSTLDLDFTLWDELLRLKDISLLFQRQFLTWFLGLSWFLRRLIIIISVVLLVAYLTGVERIIIGATNKRWGPARTGPIGLVQPFADAFKLLFKEFVVPIRAYSRLFFQTPFIMFWIALCSWAMVPFEKQGAVSEIPSNFLLILALTSMVTYGVIMAGWASNNRYGLLGSYRASAQLISYEVIITLVLISVLLPVGSLSLSTIVSFQNISGWLFFSNVNSFLIYFICILAETSRTPFDLPEAESELVAGFHVEFSGPLFAILFLTEYAGLILWSVLTITVFFGAWSVPSFLVPSWFSDSIFFDSFWFSVKFVLFLSLLIVIRASLPRFRYDQLMKFAWQVLLPCALFNLFITIAIWINFL